jgi:hypothetical protein
MDSENKELEIVMGDDSEINISEVGDIVNTLKPHTSEKKKNIIIPVSKKKIENTDVNQEENDEIEENK